MRSMRELFRSGAGEVVGARSGPTPSCELPQHAGWVPPVRRPPIQAGPSWEATIGADAPFGEWVEVPHAGSGAIQLTWSDGPQPVLSLADQAGNWFIPEDQPAAPLYTSWVALAAGWTWVSVEAPWAAEQGIRVAVWLPAAPAAGAPPAG